MTALTPPRHALVEAALADARAWCAGHIIDDQPALVHAVRVARTVSVLYPPAAPWLVAAALLHDSPEFAPAGLDLDEVLIARYGPNVRHVVIALEAEHHRLDHPDPPVLVDDVAVLLVSTADRIVAFTSLLRRAARSGDPNGFFARRTALLRLLPYFRRCQQAGQGRVPAVMSEQLDAVLTRLEQVASLALAAHRPVVGVVEAEPGLADLAGP